MSRTVLHEDERGLTYIEGNELTIESKIADPPAVNLVSAIHADGGGGGKLSFKVSRGTPGGTNDELGFLIGRQSELARGQLHSLLAELQTFLNDGSSANDDAMVRVEALPSGELPTPEPLPPQPAGALYTTADGRYQIVIDDPADGQTVVYDTKGGTMTVVWDRASYEAKHDH